MRHVRLATIVAAALVVAGCKASPPMAPNAMLVEPGAPMPPAASGTAIRWVGVGHSVQGSVRFTIVGSVARLDFSDDFSVSAVPGPFVYVNTTNNANTGKPLRVSALRSNNGAQNYSFTLPAGATYGWVLIWCDPFNVAVAEARVP